MRVLRLKCTRVAGILQKHGTSLATGSAARQQGLSSWVAAHVAVVAGHCQEVQVAVLHVDVGDAVIVYHRRDCAFFLQVVQL